MDLLLPIIIVLVIVLVVLFFLQRRQRANSDVLPPPELGQPIDYTNPELQEPETLADRIRNAPLGVKLLVPLGLVALLILGGVAYSALQPLAGSGQVKPTPEPVTLTQASATLSNPSRILAQATTNLPDNTNVQATLLEDGKAFEWYAPESAEGQVSNGRVRISLNKRANAPTPSQGKTYTVVLNASGPDGTTLSSEPAQLTVPQLYREEFFSGAVAAAPTAAATSAPKPTAAATPKPSPTAAPSAPTPTPKATATFTATVANGGNVRREPNRQGEVLDQNNANEVVTLLQKSQDGAWYQMTNPRGTTGWFSASLLQVDPKVAAQVPVEGSVPAEPPPAATTQATAQATTAATGLTGLVWNGGNLRKLPNFTAEVIDQNNANETVTLVAKTADGRWYKVTNPRGNTGWFSASLLRIQPDVAKRVPVGQ